MLKSSTLWIIAFLLTTFVASYQRVTGPTYPLSGKAFLGSNEFQYKLLRSHGGDANAPVQIMTSDSAIEGYVEWKRFKTTAPWNRLPLQNQKGALSAELPAQPPAGKLEYRVVLSRGDTIAILPADHSVAIRFKGEIPLMILIPHIIAMFASMLIAARAGLGYFSSELESIVLTYWIIGFLIVGGLVLGPIVQKYAFGVWWTGWPFGHDLTDNKTAFALIAWIVVALTWRKVKNPKALALGAAIIMFAVYLIPHSVLGSELDYKTLDENRARSDSAIQR